MFWYLSLISLLAILIVGIIGFIVYKHVKIGKEGRKKSWKLLKNITLSILITYFISGIFPIVQVYSYMFDIDYIEESSFEEYLSEIENSTIYNNKIYVENTIEGCLKTVQYINEHPNLSEFAKEEHRNDNEEMTQLTKDYYELYQIVGTLAYDENCTIQDIQYRFKNGEKNTVSDFFESKNYDKDTFYDMIGLVDISQAYQGIAFCDQQVYEARKILNDQNISVDEEIQKIKSGDVDEISKYVDGFMLLGYKYPYATEQFSEQLSNLSSQITSLIYSIVIGIFIGVIVYAYNEICSTWQLAAIVIIEIILMSIMEEFVLIDIGHIYLAGINITYGGSSNLPIKATTVVATIAIVILIIKVILNELQVKKLNRLK